MWSTALCGVRASLPLLIANVSINVWFADMTAIQIAIQAMLVLAGSIVVARAARRNYARAVERYLMANQAQEQSHQE